MNKGSKGKKANKPLPADIEEKRTRVQYKTDEPKHAATYEYHGVFNSLGFDNSFDLEEFKENFQIKVISVNDEEAVFDLIGVDPAIANALRRICISEVPTMAIETVSIINNTSIMQDEVLSHRLGLIPIKVDPRQFEYRDPNGDITDKDTITFTLNVTCTKVPNMPETAPPREKYKNSAVYSADLKWNPVGNQDQIYDNIRPVHEDILITKLRPGQSIELQVHCNKGVGKTHAKWSPVATASYRLLPEITITSPIKNEQAKEFVKVCPMGVFDIEDIGKGKQQAVVANPRSCTMCRECIRDEKWQDKVKLARKKDHFIFSIESTGILTPATIFTEAIKVMIEKISVLEAELEKLTPTMQVDA